MGAIARRSWAALGEPVEMEMHPDRGQVQVAATGQSVELTQLDDKRLRQYRHPSERWSLLAIPWFIVATFWLILFAFTHLFAWVAVVILGRYPQWLYEFNSGVVRFSIRTSAWIYLQTYVWPPFSLSDDPSYPIRVNFAPAAERQSRLKAFFRIILVLPVLLVLSYGTTYI